MVNSPKKLLLLVLLVSLVGCKSNTITQNNIAGGDGGTHTDNCTGPADCPTDQACSNIDPDAQKFSCQAVNKGKNAIAQHCSSNADCLTNFCIGISVGGACSERCSADSDCGGTTVCAVPVNSGLASGWDPSLCLPPCQRDTDCPSGWVCWAHPTPGNVSLVASCEPPRKDGGKPGTASQDGTNCQTGLFANGFCSAACITGADCPSQIPTCKGNEFNNPNGHGTTTISVCQQ
jgi:hypothetical protein